MHKDVKDLRLHLPADVSDAIIKDLLEKLSNVKGWDKLAAITCSIAIPIRGNPRHGEFKALVGSNVSSTLPKTAAECMALLKEDTTHMLRQLGGTRSHTTCRGNKRAHSPLDDGVRPQPLKLVWRPSQGLGFR